MFTGENLWKISLERPRRRRQVDIKIDLRDIGFEDGRLRGIVSETCSKGGFGVSCVETSGSTALVLVG